MGAGGPVAGGADPGDQLVEVVDEAGSVLDVVTRRRMRAGKLRHRCTYVAVLVGPPGVVSGVGPGTELVVHRRADWKDTYPSHWDVAFGGVCGVGESWAASAARELAEEAGIEGAELTDLGPVRYDDADNHLVGRLFVTAWPDEPRFLDGEVAAADRVTLGDLAAWVAREPVCPDSAAVVVPRLLDLAARPI